MGRRGFLALGLSGWIVAALSAAQSTSPAQPAKTPVSPPPIQAVVDTYCLTCHNQRLKTGGLSLEGVDSAHPAANAELWERVIAKLRAGTMPPPGLPRPDATRYNASAS